LRKSSIAHQSYSAEKIALLWRVIPVLNATHDLWHARVSSGCKKVFRKVASGAKTDRAQLRRLLGQLEAGDVTVTRLDRLARSTRDLLNALATITGEQARFRSLGDTWADTTHHTGG
jgi:DNA invertase Pin-like site-specific DNA recombinase